MATPAGSSAFNLFVLRRLYNKDNKGRGTQGEVRRVDFHATLTHRTALVLGQTVPMGRGQYASPTLEIGIRLLLYLVSPAVNLMHVGEELALSVLDRQAVVNRLRQLADFVESYK